MKILYAGNTANIGYLVTAHMRKINVEMELLMDSKPSVTSDPLIRDPELNNVYPKWIHFYDKTKPKWKRNILKKMKEYDLVQSNSNLIIYSYFARKPSISQPIGSELRITAFSNSLKGMLFRKALQNAKAVIISSPEMIDLTRKLKLKNTVFIPFFLDVSFFQPKKNLKEKYENKLVIFSPTTQNWDWKGNDRLVLGFAKFSKVNPNALLFLVDNGTDSSKTHELVKSLNLEKFVHFLKGPLKKSELEYYYGISDIVADQFIVGELGGIAREALCLEKPLITGFNESKYSFLYSNLPPISSAFTVEDIFKQLLLLTDEDIRKKIGKENFNWITKNNFVELYQKKSKLLYELILAGGKISAIRTEIDCNIPENY